MVLPRYSTRPARLIVPALAPAVATGIRERALADAGLAELGLLLLLFRLTCRCDGLRRCALAGRERRDHDEVERALSCALDALIDRPLVASMVGTSFDVSHDVGRIRWFDG